MYEFVHLSESDFLTFSAEAQDANYLQTPEMKKFREKRGARGYYVGVRYSLSSDSVPVLVLASLVFSLPIRFGYKFEIAGGPIGDYESEQVLVTFLNGIRSFAKSHGGLYLELEPDITYQELDNQGQSISSRKDHVLTNFLKGGAHHLGFYTGYPYGTPRFWYVKNLEAGSQNQLAKFYEKNAQYSLKKAGKFGIQVRSLEYNELGKFKNLTRESADHHDFSDKDLAYYQEFYRVFGGNAQFLVAEIDFSDYRESLRAEIAKLRMAVDRSSSAKKAKQRAELAAQIDAHQKRLEEADHLSAGESGPVILSGGLFVYHPRETVYLFSGTLDKYRNLYAPYLIQEEIMRRTLERGVLRYNFWGIQGVFDGTDGVLRFKEGFQGHVEEKIGRFILIAHPFKYKLTQILKKVFRR